VQSRYVDIAARQKLLIVGDDINCWASSNGVIAWKRIRNMHEKGKKCPSVSMINIWPESVIISNWYYLKPSETRQRSNVNTGRENVALAAAAVVTGSSAAASTEGPLDSDAIGDDAELRETMNTDAEEEATEISESTVIIIDGAASVQA